MATSSSTVVRDDCLVDAMLGSSCLLNAATIEGRSCQPEDPANGAEPERAIPSIVQR